MMRIRMMPGIVVAAGLAAVVYTSSEGMSGPSLRIAMSTMTNLLRRNQRQLAPAGELVARTEGASPDGCKASCVDWYGNARPIFLGSRIFALMGYELVEGALVDGRIVERRRASFAPRSARGG